MQIDKVINPPLMISVSVGVNSRAPRRINTLFESFITFSFHNLGSVMWVPKRSEMEKLGPRTDATIQYQYFS